MRSALLTPLVVLIACLVAFAASLVWAATELPVTVASHFNAAGAADGWMSRQAHLLLMGWVGLGMPLLLAGIFYSVRWLPAGIVNMPHREYWLAPERRAETSLTMLRFGLWVAVMFSALFLVIHILAVEANRVQPARLTNWVWGVLVVFLAALGVWLVAFYREFGWVKDGKSLQKANSPSAMLPE